jgi:hypothetical protein
MTKSLFHIAGFTFLFVMIVVVGLGSGGQVAVSSPITLAIGPHRTLMQVNFLLYQQI